MITTILTPDEAKAARAAVGLSQNKVAQSVGISRTNLALFEVKKYLLDDNALTRLKQFYIDAGYAFAGSATVEQPGLTADAMPKDTLSHGIRLMDGYAIPEGIDEDEAEGILAEIADNDSQIEELSAEIPDVGWFSDEPDTEGLDQLLRLNARNYVLTRLLQGHDWNSAQAANDDGAADSATNGMLFNAAIQK